MNIENARRLRALLSCTLASRLTLSFHLIRQAISEGNTSTNILSIISMMSNDMRARI